MTDKASFHFRNVINIDIMKHIPFQSDVQLKWFFLGDPSVTPASYSSGASEDATEHPNDAALRVKALLNYVVGMVPITNTYAANAMKHLFTREYMASHYWPTEK